MGVKRRTSEPARSLRCGASSVGGGSRRTVTMLRREAKTAPVEAAATLRGAGVAKAAEVKYTTKIVLACIDTTRTCLVFARVSVWFYSLPPLRRRLLPAEQTRTRRLLRFAVKLTLPSARLLPNIPPCHMVLLYSAGCSSSPLGILILAKPQHFSCKARDVPAPGMMAGLQLFYLQNPSFQTRALHL